MSNGVELINRCELEVDTEWDDYEDGFISYSKRQIEDAPKVEISKAQRFLVEKVDIDEEYFIINFNCPLCKTKLGSKGFHQIQPTKIYPKGLHEYTQNSVLANHELPAYCPFCGQKLDINIENYVKELK